MMRLAELKDLPALEQLEKSCFPSHRCSNRRSLRMSIQSPTQIVMLLDAPENGELAGALILICYKSSLRIYSLAVRPEYRTRGYGGSLLDEVFEYARQNGFQKITLEADKQNQKLVEWYCRYGFEVRETIKDYYATGEDAVRMRKMLQLDTDQSLLDSPNLIVVDQPKNWPFSIPRTQVVSAKTYLSNSHYQNSSLYRIFNLCHSFKPHKFGYYVSLLASARDQRVIPNVTSLRDLSSVSLVQSVADDLENALQEHLKKVTGDKFSLNVYFENTPQKGFSGLAKLLSQQFELLLFKADFEKEDGKWNVNRIQPLLLANVLKTDMDLVGQAATTYFGRKRFRRTRFKHFHYDLAILVDPAEKTPPSCQEALHRMRDAAEKTGFYTEFITRNDYNRICEFDALFIRETTSVDNHTYKFSRRAYSEGLIVIDDPWSILRCSNKMYLYERLSRSRVRQPRSWLICKENIKEEDLAKYEFPLVLKLPESCFSTGVFKVANREEMVAKLELLFKTSEVVIAQQFLKTPFDWRIGILDGSPLFACKYHMADGHWQIYNWLSEDSENVEGNAETLPLNQVPTSILQTATRGAALIGDGLYGVDLKEHHGKAYIIEINDNPNIDAGIEDAILQEELYLKLARSFYNRIERERKAPHFVSYRDD